MTRSPPGSTPLMAVDRHAVPARTMLLAVGLLVLVHVAIARISPAAAPDLQHTFGPSLNTGVVLALALLPSRRRLPLLLGAALVGSALVHLPTEPPALALAVAVGNLPAVLVFRVLALRWSAGARRMESRRCLLALLGAGAGCVAADLLVTGVLVALGVGAGWLRVDAPTLRVIALARPLAQFGGLATVTPLVLFLVRDHPTAWRRRIWAEIGGWLGMLAAVAVVAVEVPAPFPLDPVLLLVAFAGLVFAVLGRGGPAAAVLSPAFAVTAAVVMIEPGGTPGAGAAGPAPSSLLLAQLAGLVAGLLAWAAAAVVAERDEGRRLAESEAAAQQALTAVQAALLPSRVTSQRGVTIASRYRAAGSFDLIGGDWYDTVPLPAGGLGLVIGDVEGHDLTAASVMGLVRGAVRSFALEGHPPSVLLERVGAFLASAGTDRLVTMAYVQLHADDRTATMALAGHPAPLVVPARGPVEVLEHARGPVLGVEGLAGWTERTVCLPRDASLVLYTDGLVDAPSVARGPERCAASLLDGVPRRDVDRIADELIDAAPAYDDAAVLVARVTSDDATQLRRTLPARPSSAGIARSWVRDVLRIWRDAGTVPPVLDREWTDAAELLVTELMSNAVRHSDRWVTVRLSAAGRRLRVEVEDGSERMPSVRDPGTDAAEGRGLRLVEALSEQWGVELVERGKIVWCELDLVGRSIVLPDAGARAEPVPRA